MTPLEAVARALYDSNYGAGAWDQMPEKSLRDIYFTHAEAAIIALADNVSKEMVFDYAHSRYVQKEGAVKFLSDAIRSAAHD